MANNAPTPPEKTFNSMFRRFFDIPDSEPVWPTQHPVPRSSSAIWAGAADEENSEKRDTIAKRHLGKAKSTANLRISTTSNPTYSHTHSDTHLDPNPNISHFSSTSTSSVIGTVSRFRNPFCSNTSSNTSSAAPTPPPTSHLGNGAGRGGGATGANFELTPLSGLIQQSIKDIEVLKKVHASRTKNGAGKGGEGKGEKAGGIFGGKDKGKGKEKMEGSGGNGGVEGKVGEIGMRIDFERVEENLRRFEEVYQQFLASSAPHGRTREEVHLVAMVCKRSEVVKGKFGSGEGVPKARVADCCL